MKRDPIREPSLGRLTRRREFVAAAKGRRQHAALFSLQAVGRDATVDTPRLRVGLTVTKKTGHATERNRIRRRLRAALRAAALPDRDLPADVVVMARRDVLSAPFGRLVAELDGAIAAIARKVTAASRAGRDAAPQRLSVEIASPDLNGHAAGTRRPIPVRDAIHSEPPTP